MAEKVLTMAGATTGEGSCAPCPPCVQQRTTLVVTKKQRYPHGRHCTKLNEQGNCRCAKWGSGKGESVTSLCKKAGREFKIGGRVLKARG